MDEMPEQVTDDYQQDPYQQISKAKYLNMMICHAISITDELKFMKLIGKMKALEFKDDNDKILKNNLDILKDKSFSEVR